MTDFTLPYNPFSDYSIANYEQYKRYPHMMSTTLELIKDRIKGQIAQIQNGFFFGERLLLLGTTGSGKTTTLFFIHDMLKDKNINVFQSSRLIENAEHFLTLTGKSLYSTVCGENGVRRPFYLLIDFPDDVAPSQYRGFLKYLWDIIINKDLFNYVNLIFALNKSHYDKSFTYSEILGKFLPIRLERFTFEETRELLVQRLSLVNAPLEKVFEEPVVELIYSYSKGIPRNIISAAGMLVSNDNFPIKEAYARTILTEKFTDKILSERIEDLHLRLLYKEMMDVLKNEFDGTALSQEAYVEALIKRTKISRVTALKHIRKLASIGLININRGGYNLVNKVITLR